MKNKRGNVAVIAIIIVIVAITASVITWIVATKSQAPVQQAVVNQPTPDTKTKPISQPAQVDTSSDWKMYTSNLGFSFEYPKTKKFAVGVEYDFYTILDSRTTSTPWITGYCQ